MEYREPPRIAASERRFDGVVDDPNPRPRLRRFEFVRAERQLDFPRLAVGLLMATFAVAVVGYLLIQLSRSAIDWLHHQAQYQLKFNDIELNAPPPSWFRGGTEAFLNQVRQNAKEAEILELMELQKGEMDKDQIAIDFRKDPWVEEVTRVEYPPHAIRVHLVYKTPVAFIQTPLAVPVYLDRKGCILPIEDVDKQNLGPLIPISGKGLDQGAAANQPGLHWRSSVPGNEGDRLKDCVEDAAALAAFLLEPDRVKQTMEIPALRITRIIAADHRGLWLVNTENAMILWGEAPGKESIGSLKGAEKWEILEKWARQAIHRSLPSGDYWQFSRSELIPVQTH
jgi:hypothetical protein